MSKYSIVLKVEDRFQAGDTAKEALDNFTRTCIKVDENRSADYTIELLYGDLCIAKSDEGYTWMIEDHHVRDYLARFHPGVEMESLEGSNWDRVFNLLDLEDPRQLEWIKEQRWEMYS